MEKSEDERRVDDDGDERAEGTATEAKGSPATDEPHASETDPDQAPTPEEDAEELEARRALLGSEFGKRVPRLGLNYPSELRELFKEGEDLERFHRRLDEYVTRAALFTPEELAGLEGYDDSERVVFVEATEVTPIAAVAATAGPPKEEPQAEAFSFTAEELAEQQERRRMFEAFVAEVAEFISVLSSFALVCEEIRLTVKRIKERRAGLVQRSQTLPRTVSAATQPSAPPSVPLPQPTPEVVLEEPTEVLSVTGSVEESASVELYPDPIAQVPDQLVELPELHEEVLAVDLGSAEPSPPEGALPAPSELAVVEVVVVPVLPPVPVTATATVERGPGTKKTRSPRRSDADRLYEALCERELKRSGRPFDGPKGFARQFLNTGDAGAIAVLLELLESGRIMAPGWKSGQLPHWNKLNFPPEGSAHAPTARKAG